MKRILVLSASILAATFANASFLLWQVDTTDYSGKITDTVNRYQLWTTDGTTSTKLQTTSTAGSPNNYDVSSYSTGNYSFYVELVNWESADKVTTVAKSESVTYSELSANIVTTLESVSSVSPWHASNYESVPEPTTGLMLLLGLSLVSLKRRKV